MFTHIVFTLIVYEYDPYLCFAKIILKARCSFISFPSAGMRESRNEESEEYNQFFLFATISLLLYL